METSEKYTPSMKQNLNVFFKLTAWSVFSEKNLLYAYRLEITFLFM